MKLEICDVSKQYKDKCAVDHANLTLTPGVWGLLGANGAGKTTLMRMIAGIMKPTGGEIRYDGIEIDTLGEKYRDIFGYLPQEFGFYPGFSVQDYLEYMDEDIKTPDHIYQERLSACSQCGFLRNGMCRLCGCFVALRAAKIHNHCADTPVKW